MDTTTYDITLCGRPLAECLEVIENFHGWQAPGLVLGLFMVDWAQELMGPGVEADAIVETRHCLPDAVQLFTPCTVGNGWLKVLNWDKFAVSLYDRRLRSGYRVWLDLAKASAYPNLYNWYMRLIPKKELPLPILIETILQAKRTALSARDIYLTGCYQRHKKGAINICPSCGEACAAHQGPQCRACQGHGYYRPRS